MNVRHRAILVLLGACLLHGCSGKLILTRPLEVERDDWPAFGRTAEHTHEASGPVRPPLELRWEYDLGAGAAGGTPIVIDGIVFAGNLRGELHALSLEDGKRLGWTRLGDAVHGSPVFRSRTLFVPLTNTEESLVAFDLSTGTALWRKEYGEIETSLVLANGSLYVGNLAGEFFCVNPSDGSRRWKFRISDNTSLKGIRSTAAVHDSTVVFGADDGAVYALDANSGRLLWRHVVGTALFAPVTIDSSLAFAAALDGTVAALDLGTGRPVWTFRAGAPVQGHVLAGADLAIVATTAGDIVGLRPADGAVRWHAPVGAPLSAGLIRAGDCLYAVTLKRELIALNASDGVVLWRTEVEGRIKTPAIASGGTLIIVTDDKTIFAFRGIQP